VTNPSTKVICDAGPFIHLDELNCLDLLADFEQIVVPLVVEKEILEHRPTALQNHALNINRSSERTGIGEELLALCRIFSLDAGEIEALALMEQNPQHIFLTDDAAARLVATQMKFKVHGTIGVLIRSIRRRLRKPEEILYILAEIPPKSTLHIKPTLLNEIIQMVKNEYNL
jgi:predicted nucleic acid-binding protein